MVAPVVGAAQYAASGREMIVVAVRFRIRSHIFGRHNCFRAILNYGVLLGVSVIEYLRVP